MRQPVHKRRWIQSFNIHKLSDTNGKEISQTDLQKERGEEILQTVSFIKCTHLVIPTALPPITSLGGIRMPITLPRGTSTRRRTLDRATGFGRTGTNTGTTLMHRRWRLRNLFWQSRIPGKREWRRPILRQAKRQAHVLIRSLHRRGSEIPRIQRGGKVQKVPRGHSVPRVRQKPIRIYIHRRSIVPSRKRTVALPKGNRILLLPI